MSQEARPFKLDPSLDGLALARRWMELGLAGGFPGHIRARPTAVEAGFIRIEAEIDAVRHANFVGLTHGGMTAALVDIAGGGAAMTLLKSGEFLLSTDLNLRFLNPAPIECGRLIAEGRAAYHDARKVVAEVRVLTPDERLIAHGTAAISIRPPKI